MKPERPARIVFSILTTCALMILFANCGKLMRPPHPIYFYTLDYAPPIKITEPPMAAVLRVSRFSAAPPYGSDQMFYGSTQTGREAYAFHKWRARPAELVESLFLRDFRESGSFAGVFSSSQRMGTTHAIEGIVESFYQKESGERKMAVVEIAITLLSETEPDPVKRVRFQRRYHEEEPLSSGEPRYLAEAMSRAMARLSGSVRADVAAELNRKP